MEPLFGKTLPELENVATQLGMQRFTAKQMADWLYKKNVVNIEQMTNLPKQAREKMSVHYTIGKSAPVKEQVSQDGTKKYLFPVLENKTVEAAYIPDKDRATLCLSTQVGCKMGCLFCMTAKQGFQGNLSTTDILNQIASLPEREKLTNLVYMGMGEPLDNLDNVMKSLEIISSDYGYAMSPKRVTISTVGIIPAMKHFLENSNCHLAISLHSPFEEERKSLMPIQSVYSLKEVINEVKRFHFGMQRRLSFEYIMFKGVNDTPEHVKEMKRLLYGVNCRVNLIRFHPIPGTPLTGSDDRTLIKFRDALTNSGIFTTIRQSRGQDIYAACGLLSTKESKVSD